MNLPSSRVSNAHIPQPRSAIKAPQRCASSSLCSRVIRDGKYSITRGSAFISANGSKSSSRHWRINSLGVVISIIGCTTGTMNSCITLLLPCFQRRLNFTRLDDHHCYTKFCQPKKQQKSDDSTTYTVARQRQPGQYRTGGFLNSMQKDHIGSQAEIGQRFVQ